MENERETATKLYTTKLESLADQYGASAKAILGTIEEKKGQVEKLFGVIGNLAVTSGHLKAANYARIMTWLWHSITLLSLIGLIVFGCFVFLPAITSNASAGPSNLSWESLAARIVLTLTFGVLAAYAARQADKYLDIERRNRKLALEFEGLGPYLAPLPREKQDEFRVLMADRSFGREEPTLRRDDRSPATLVDVLLESKEFRKVMGEAVKAAKSG